MVWLSMVVYKNFVKMFGSTQVWELIYGDMIWSRNLIDKGMYKFSAFFFFLYKKKYLEVSHHLYGYLTFRSLLVCRKLHSFLLLQYVFPFGHLILRLVFLICALTSLSLTKPMSVHIPFYRTRTRKFRNWPLSWNLQVSDAKHIGWSCLLY